MKAEHRIIAVLAGAGLVAALAVALAFLTFLQLQSATKARKDTYELIIGANALLSALKDVETGERGYALTGDESFLAPYLEVRGQVRGRLRELRSLASIEAAKTHLDAMAPLIETKLAQLAEVIEMRRRHDMAAATSLVAGGQGKRTMQEIRVEMDSFLRVEQEALAEREAYMKSKMGQMFADIIAASLLTLLLALLFAYLIHRESQHRVRAQVHLETLHLLAVQDELNHRLQSASLAKSEFLSSMSHELRTPLNAILGFAQLLEMGKPSVAQQHSIGQILKAGWHLLVLINEILDLSQIESGKFSLSPEPLSLAEVMLECQAMIEPQAQKRGIHLAFPRLDAPIFVKADRTRIKQVLINLLSNAIKYNKVDGKVTVDCAVDPAGRVRISVADTGAGLTPDNLAHLFQPFNRLGQEGHAEEGTGIGLVVCKRLTELMGGTIGVTSTVGKGSVFWIELALASGPQPGAPLVAPAAAAWLQAQPEGPLHTLLYVEDNPANLALIEQLIELRPDFRLLTAREGSVGVEIARSARPDVILMDINLPGISGLEALTMLALDPVTAHIPVIALSANAMPHDVERGMQAGFFRYLTKPVKVAEFMNTLDQALQLSQVHRAIADKKQIVVA